MTKYNTSASIIAIAFSLADLRLRIYRGRWAGRSGLVVSRRQHPVEAILSARAVSRFRVGSGHLLFPLMSASRADECHSQQVYFPRMPCRRWRFEPSQSPPVLAAAQSYAMPSFLGATGAAGHYMPFSGAAGRCRARSLADGLAIISTAGMASSGRNFAHAREGEGIRPRAALAAAEARETIPETAKDAYHFAPDAMMRRAPVLSRSLQRFRPPHRSSIPRPTETIPTTILSCLLDGRLDRHGVRRPISVITPRWRSRPARHYRRATEHTLLLSFSLQDERYCRLAPGTRAPELAPWPGWRQCPAPTDKGHFTSGHGRCKIDEVILQYFTPGKGLSLSGAQAPKEAIATILRHGASLYYRRGEQVGA